MFRSSLSYMTSHENTIDGKVLLDGEAWNVIPVTRYAQGMSRGLFFQQTPETRPSFCGTFFYHEPDPACSTLLAYKTSFRAFNKTDAMQKLGLLNLTNPFDYDIYHETIKHIAGVYPRDLRLTPLEAATLMLNEDIDDRGVASKLPQIPHYAGEYLELYAIEDVFDQSLCIGARQAGYDVVILENMVGSFQVVTEILDTRSREESFRHLVYIVD